MNFTANELNPHTARCVPDLFSVFEEWTVEPATGGTWTQQTATVFCYDRFNLVGEDIGGPGFTPAETNYFAWVSDLNGAPVFNEFSANVNVGQTVSSYGSLAAASHFCFSTKYGDSDLGLYYFGYRYYSSGIGRWISRDPLGEFGGLNLLLFCRNNALIFVDAFGLIDEQYEDFTGHPLRWVEGDDRRWGNSYSGLLRGCLNKDVKISRFKCPKEKCPGGLTRYKMDYVEVVDISITSETIYLPRWKDAADYSRDFQNSWKKIFEFVRDHEIGHIMKTREIHAVFDGKKRSLSVEGCSLEELGEATEKLCMEGPIKDFDEALNQAHDEYHREVGYYIKNIWAIMFENAKIEVSFEPK